MNSKIAYVPVTATRGSAYQFTVGVATLGIAGYNPLRDTTGIQFQTYEQASEWAQEHNRAFGLTDQEALEIQASSMSPTAARW